MTYRTLTKKEWDRIPEWRKWKKGKKMFALFQVKKGTSYRDIETTVHEVRLKRMM